jgi:hypothetical protein
MRWWIVVLSLVCSAPAAAQISPPGLGEAETAEWFALGLRQDLDARRASMTYVGVGAVAEHQAQPNEPAILVLNEEISDQLAEHWSYSYALSYRRQNEYFLHDSAVAKQQELRMYGRLNGVLRAGRLKLTTTFRPELRTFYTVHFARAEEPLQLRLRVREQATVALDAHAVHRLIGSAEVLSSVAKGPSGWSELGYRESRFCVYYSLDREQWPVVINVGYMNDLIGSAGAVTDVHYLALDLTWENPFGTPHG